MAQKLLLVIVVFLVVGALIGQSSAEEVVALSEQSSFPAETLEDVAHEGHLRVKRGGKWKRRLRRLRNHVKPVAKAVITKVATDAAIAALG